MADNTSIRDSLAELEELSDSRVASAVKNVLTIISSQLSSSSQQDGARSSTSKDNGINGACATPPSRKRTRSEAGLDSPIEGPSGSGPCVDSLEEGMLDDDEVEINEISDEDDELLVAIQREFDADDKTGPNVQHNLASIVNARFDKPLADDTLNQRLDRYSRPSNCEKLIVPRLNREIYTRIPSFAKKADAKMATIQRTVVRSACALVKTISATLEAKKNKTQMDLNEVIRTQTDALALLGHATTELSKHRRLILKPQINKQLQTICDRPYETDPQLFGSNLPSAIKEARETDKIGSRVGNERKYRKDGGYRAKNSHYSSGFGHGSGYGSGGRPFLGQRQRLGGKPPYHQKNNYNKKKA